MASPEDEGTLLGDLMVNGYKVSIKDTIKDLSYDNLNDITFSLNAFENP